MQSALCQGVVTHQRRQPKAHQFQYDTFMVYLKLDALDEFFARSRWWSLERFNWASFRRKDYLHPQIPDLQQAVQQEIRQQTGQVFAGDIFLLTHVRYLGYCFNPVSFYFCFEQEQLKFIVAEITNTPWNERFCYVLTCSSHERVQHFQFQKQFHVSPFLPMDLQYDWRFSLSEDQIHIFMRNRRQGEEQFMAGMTLQMQEASTTNLRNMLLRFPAVTVKTVAGIYWQALRLWLKGTPFYDHPTDHEGPTHGIIHAHKNQHAE